MKISAATDTQTTSTSSCELLRRQGASLSYRTSTSMGLFDHVGPRALHTSKATRQQCLVTEEDLLLHP